MLVLLVVGAIIVVVVLLATIDKGPSRRSEVSALNDLTAEIKSNLGACTMSAGSLRDDVANLLQNGGGASPGGFASLSTASTIARIECDQAHNEHIRNLARITVPAALSEFAALHNAPVQAGIWATGDTTPVIRDVQDIGESGTATNAEVSKLLSDARKADGVAQHLQAQFSATARQLGMAPPSLNLVEWIRRIHIHVHSPGSAK